MKKSFLILPIIAIAFLFVVQDFGPYDPEIAPGESTPFQPTVTDDARCDESYPDVCIPEYPPDLDCDQIPFSNFIVIGEDRHGFDGDGNGIGCES